MCLTPASWSGAIPARLWLERRRGVARYLFRHGARRAGDVADDRPARHGHDAHGHGVPALEMTKWFDTNYHYMVPEFAARQTLRAVLAEAARRVPRSQGARLSHAAGAARAGDLPDARQEQGRRARSAVAAATRCCRSMTRCCGALPRRRRVGADRRAVPGARSRRRDARGAAPGLWRAGARAAALKILLRPISAALGDNLDTALRCRSPGCISISCGRRSSSTPCWRRRRAGLVLSLGVIDGRNIWRADLPALLDRLEPIVAKRGADRVQIAPSCSLLHVPVDLELETDARCRREELARLRRPEDG